MAAPADTTVAEPALQSSEAEVTLPPTVADGGSSQRKVCAPPHMDALSSWLTFRKFQLSDLPRTRERTHFLLAEEQVDNRPARVGVFFAHICPLFGSRMPITDFEHGVSGPLSWPLQVR